MYRYICPEAGEVLLLAVSGTWSHRREPEIAQYGSMSISEFDEYLKQNKEINRC